MLRMRFGFLAVLFFACCNQSNLTGEDKTIVVTKEEGVYSSATISVDPSNDRNMLIASTRWVDFTSGALKHHVVAFITSDGGKTWTESELPKAQGQTNSSHPSVHYTEDGIAYLCHSFNESRQNGKKIAVHRSKDKGKTWDQTTIIRTQTNELPNLSSDLAGNLYVVSSGSSRDRLLRIANPAGTAAIVMAKSSNQGRSFQVVGISLDNNNGIGPFKISVFKDGSMFLPFLQFTRPNPTNRSFIYGLRTFESKQRTADLITIRELPRRTPYLSNNAIDLRANVDRLYLAYSEGTQNSLSTAVIHSSDKGKTWSRPKVVASKNKGNYSRLPTIAVSANGTVGVSWVQREKDSDCWQVYFSHSKNGGEVFSGATSLSSKNSCPNSREISSIGNGFARRAFTYGGHYMGLDTTKTGFQAAWVDLSRGRFEIVTRNITIEQTK